MNSKKLALLDRDGTLIEHIPYLQDPALVKLLPGTVEGLLALRERGFWLVMVSNQSGVGRGYFACQAVEAVNGRMQQLLTPYGAQLDLLLYCPHAPDEGCLCRKPAPGMAWQACEKLGSSLQGALMVGDSDCDMQLARHLGIRGYLLGQDLPSLDRLAAHL